MTPYTIRPLRESDRATWQPLWEQYLRFYRTELSPEVYDATFARLCDVDGDMLGLLAVDAHGAAAGLSHLIFHPTGWAIEPSCYLQDLYVDPDRRGSGLSTRLFDAIYAAARGRGATSVYWHTQQFNGAARSLYDTVGRLSSYIMYSHDL